MVSKARLQIKYLGSSHAQGHISHTSVPPRPRKLASPPRSRFLCEFYAYTELKPTSCLPGSPIGPSFSSESGLVYYPHRAFQTFV